MGIPFMVVRFNGTYRLDRPSVDYTSDFHWNSSVRYWMCFDDRICQMAKEANPMITLR